MVASTSLARCIVCVPPIVNLAMDVCNSLCSPRTSVLAGTHDSQTNSLDADADGGSLPSKLFHSELLRILGIQALPAAELHSVGAYDAPNGLTGEKLIQHIEADVPPSSTH